MIHKILSVGAWALEARYHERMAAVVLAGHLATVMTDEEDKPVPHYVSAEGSYYYENYIEKVKSKAGRVAIIPLEGTMSRDGDWCSWGTEAVGEWVMEADADESVVGMVLAINSPGGEVSGTELLADIVANTKKPVVAYVKGMAASAAYWVASQCDHIVMESATASEVGSIGVLAMHVDLSGAYEKAGFKVTIIRAEGSENKALFNSVEPLSDDLIASVREEMRPIREAFVKAVQKGRAGIDKGVYGGKMYNGRTAISLGMADEIGYLGDAVNAVVRLAS